MRPYVVLALLIAQAAPAAAYDHKDEVTTYAAAAAVSQVGADRCPDILARADVAPALGGNLHITAADDMAVRLEVRGLMAAFRENADKYGKAWCDQQMERFGPEGTLMPGLLKKE